MLPVQVFGLTMFWTFPHTWLEIPATKTPSATVRGWEVERLRGCRQVQSRHVLPPTKGFAFCKKSVAKKEEYVSGKVQRICSCQYSFQTSRPVLDHIHRSLIGKLLERFVWMYWCTFSLMWSLSCLKITLKTIKRWSIEFFNSAYLFICTCLCFLHRLYLLNADSDSECPSWTL